MGQRNWVKRPCSRYFHWLGQTLHLPQCKGRRATLNAACMIFGPLHGASCRLLSSKRYDPIPSNKLSSNELAGGQLVLRGARACPGLRCQWADRLFDRRCGGVCRSDCSADAAPAGESRSSRTAAAGPVQERDGLNPGHRKAFAAAHVELGWRRERNESRQAKS